MAAERSGVDVLTLFFTDIEGSTRLWEAHPEEMPEVLTRHDRLLETVVAEHGGRIFKHTGDGVCAVFGRPAAAAGAALDAQRAMSAEDWGAIAAVRIRAAVHAGDVTVRGSDLAGPALSRCARLLAAAHGGQIVVSRAAVELIGSSLPSDATLVDLGEHRLRDLARSERVYQLGDGRLPSQFPALRTLDAHPHNLPVQTTVFVARSEETTRLVDTIVANALVTLTGPGGVGKTRRALQAAAEALGRFPDGAWLCELGALSDPEAVPLAAATALGAAQLQGCTTTESLVEFLRLKDILVVIDNCEHLLGPVAALVEQVIRACPDVRLVTTSREPVGVEGEQVWPVRSLPVPDPALHHTVDAILASEAVQLFVDRARTVRPDFLLTPDNAVAVGEICRRLDGIPLAIELAAARMQSMSPAEIAGRLSERFRLLTGGRRNALERHQTLRGTVTWSHDLLGDAERVLFRRLGVFAGEYDLDGAESVCAGGEIDRDDVLDLLATLVAKSMVVANDTGAVTRYRLLETLRQFAFERLEEASEGDEYRRRHADHFTRFAATAGDRMRGPDEPRWVTRVEEELDNLRSAFHWALDSEQVALALSLFGPLWFLPFFGEPLAFEIASWAEMAIPMPAADDSPAFVDACAWAGHVGFWRGEMDSAVRYAGLGNDAAAAQGRPPSAVCDLILGSGMLMQGDLASAVEHFRDAVRRARTVPGDELMLAFALTSFASIATNADPYRKEALDYSEEAVALARRIANPSMLAYATGALALSLVEIDDDRALALGAESSAAATLTRSRFLAGLGPIVAAHVRTPRGDLAALEGVVRTIRAVKIAGNRAIVTTWLLTAAGLLAAAGCDEEAAEVYGAANMGGIAAFVERVVAQVDAARDRLGDTRFAAAVARGSAGTYDDVVERACVTVERVMSRTAEPPLAST